MFEYIELSSSPYEESCAAVGADYYAERSRVECKTYKAQLERLHPIPEELSGDAYFGIKRFDHDFGSYREVVIHYNPEAEGAIAFALKVEGKCPENWDETAIAELTTKGFYAQENQCHTV